ncbi:MAG: PEPxxWA-CTERM sorting domain-containing protein [Phenylobacterium sp.]|uniref:PEPxxWA-CTERM sorting domain-containing protein n=1 Tax=Phenylobacterium sp. TaxID=1871053 RepID=UPI001A5E83E8|nr:PEPxxWA-CTERM sorting domain-containing protein [Phenylobacterium sp.]MBL8770374.1 PEPxxWA-CTERM sorting domain-containing protein [Phenylobacterium sp.]
MVKVWAVVAGAACLASATGASGAILANGDFEAPYAPYALPPGWTDSAAVIGGPLNAPNLFVTDGAAYTACCGTTGSPAAKANHFATFGAGDSPNAGSYLAQSFATVAGRAYLVSFDLAAFGVAGFQSMHVSLEDVVGAATLASGDYRVASSGDLDSGFTTYTLAFTAGGAVTRLAFQNVDAVTNDIDSVVDNVSVSAAVPEPAAWALMIAGFGMTGAALRRRPLSAG